jgi:CHAT domain-containing protein
MDRLLPAGRDGTLAEEVRPLASMVRALLHPGGSSRETRAFEAARRGEWEEARALYREELSEAAGPVRQARLGLALGMLALAAGDVSEARRRLDRAVDEARRLGLPEVLWRALAARGQLAAEADADDEGARRLYEEAVLVSEKQARALAHRTDALSHGLRRGDVLRRLVQAACRRGDAAAVFRYQELERGRLLLELWRAAPPGEPGRVSAGRIRLGDHPALVRVERELHHLEEQIASHTAPADDLPARRAALLLERDRLLDEHLRDRSRATAARLPVLPELAELERTIPAGTLYVAPVLAGEDLYLLVCGAGRPARLVQAPGGVAELTGQVEALRRCLDGQLERYRQGLPLGRPERAALDARLDELGQGPLGAALWQVLDEPGLVRLVWVPDGVLHGLPVHALRRGGRYLVERHEVAFTFGGALLFHHLSRPARPRTFGPAVVLSESPAVLPGAAREAEGVAATFWRARHLTGQAASRAGLRRHLGTARAVHLACHAYFDPEHPLSAHVGLPSGESWRALDWLDEPLDGLPLATLSACRSAEVGPLAGREVFGLVSGLLGSGVRAVVAGLWPVADREAGPFMWRFYRHRLTSDLPAALAAAQRDALASPDGSPLFWAAFAFFGDPAALPAPRGLARWLARRRQARHARRFPDPDRGQPVGA